MFSLKALEFILNVSLGEHDTWWRGSRRRVGFSPSSCSAHWPSQFF